MSVTLLLGPNTAAKWCYVRAKLDAATPVWRSDRLTAAESRMIGEWVRVRSWGEKFVVADISACGTPVLNALLKPLEESPEWVQWFLLSDRDVPDTVKSRAVSIWMGYLLPVDLEQALIEAGWESGEAQQYREAGTIAEAERLRLSGPSRAQTLSLLNAYAYRDEALADRVAESWSEQATGMLGLWISERVTGRPRVYSRSELSTGVDVSGVRRVYGELVRAGGNSIAAKAVLPLEVYLR